MNEDFAQARTTDFKSIPVVDLEKIDDDEGFAAIADDLIALQKRLVSSISKITASPNR